MSRVYLETGEQIISLIKTDGPARCPPCAPIDGICVCSVFNVERFSNFLFCFSLSAMVHGTTVFGGEKQKERESERDREKEKDNEERRASLEPLGVSPLDSRGQRVFKNENSFTIVRSVSRRTSHASFTKRFVSVARYRAPSWIITSSHATHNIVNRFTNARHTCLPTHRTFVRRYQRHSVVPVSFFLYRRTQRLRGLP